MIPKISFILVTARESFPYAGKPEMHLFEPTFHCFKSQTMKDFEVVVVDVCYNQRKDYFKNLQLPFKVKHIPAKPNMWIEKGFPGICAQYNKGIIYADGELLFFTGDSYIFKPDFMKNLWERYTQGYFPLAWYLYDNSFIETPDLGTASKEDIKKAYPNKEASTPIPYDILGYNGKQVSLEHRYDIAFKGNREVYSAPWQWWFGCSSASLEAMLAINGFDQRFDGDRMLLDCDVGSRLELAGYGRYLAVFKNIFLIRVPSEWAKWSTTLPKTDASIKCQSPLIYHSRVFNLPKANVQTISESDIKWIKEEWCEKLCNIRELCRKEHPWQFPFEHKEGYGKNCKKEYFEYWKTHQLTIDLVEERKKRLVGNPKYAEGTFT